MRNLLGGRITNGTGQLVERTHILDGILVQIDGAQSMYHSANGEDISTKWAYHRYHRD